MLKSIIIIKNIKYSDGNEVRWRYGAKNEEGNQRTNKIIAKMPEVKIRLILLLKKGTIYVLMLKIINIWETIDSKNQPVWKAGIDSFKIK